MVPRVDKLIRRNSELSRREIRALWRAGRLRGADGEALAELGLNIEPRSLPLTVFADDRAITLHDRFDVLQHKPAGVVTALRDATHQTAFDLLPALPLRAELRAVGRLDKDTTGLLLWTTDGALLHRMTHPRYAVEREYHAALENDFTEPPSDFTLGDGYKPAIISLRRLTRSQMHPALGGDPDHRAAITIAAGAFHEVRRIFAALGAPVTELCRVRFGSVRLPDELEPSAVVPIDLRERFAGNHPRAV